MRKSKWIGVGCACSGGMPPRCWLNADEHRATTTSSRTSTKRLFALLSFVIPLLYYNDQVCVYTYNGQNKSIRKREWTMGRLSVLWVSNSFAFIFQKVARCNDGSSMSCVLDNITPRHRCDVRYRVSNDVDYTLYSNCSLHCCVYCCILCYSY